ncbi:response regulator [Trinickia caryophylli]|uniref:Two component transcriptional regulator, LuxR family n=1 Tax=Trinickia caryophylli TaxID=28094 RepID=A0A1X7FS38_TRICW|nr:response regulator [Trinickia caryophylli]PMS11973.1 DNA-binding response regulator [Trinickia caryophylli]TRX13948.1 response regulator transcription factor [Trinickia caryophylli]WQE15546.1 response regulator [Trinickia caryophylli]SMF57762.1 two component transcriptional regulator, LuxR family [Trinickia caryophylli]GLU33703.1 DNA-binding response regulator [Trinickia caryophylli]
MINGTPDQARESIVYVVDDDQDMREAITVLLNSVDVAAQTFGSVNEFLAFDMPDIPSCLILDVRLRGQSGLAAQDQIARQRRLPIIFVTAHGDIEMSVTAMKGGAIDFLSKPFRGQDMLDAVADALAKDKTRREAERWFEILRARYESLTAREREVMALVAKGLLNKQIAAEMALSEMTVKLHRAQAMKKMEARSLADFVLKADALGLVGTRGPKHTLH